MTVRIERREAAVFVTLAWPERRNALDPARAEEVAEAVESAGQEEGAALVLTGDGAFCSGGDLRYFAELAERATPELVLAEVYGRVQKLMRALRACPLPTIAAVDGPAVGLGFDLALACDQRFVGPGASFVQGWGALGLIHGTGGLAFLEHERPGLAWQLLATQERLDAGRAVALGLAERAEPTAASAALQRAQQLDALPRAARDGYVSLTRERRWPDDEYFRRCALVQSHLLVSAEFRAAAARVLG